MRIVIPTNRRGVTIIELTIAMSLMAVVLVLIGQATVGIARQQRMVMQRGLATEEVANLMERVGMLEWDDLTPDRLRQWTVSKELAQRLPNALLKLAVDHSDDDTAAKRIAIELSWTNYAGDTSQPVRLVSWRFWPEASE